MAFQGIDIRQAGDRILFRSSLKNSAGAILATGTTNLRLYELQSDGTLKSYDWNDHTFKATALTTENQAMTHRAGNNATTNTGLWTYSLTTLTGFTAGNIYFAQVVNSGASPVEQEREFQFGGGQGASVVSIATDALNAAALASDAVAEIQSGLATAAVLAIIAGYLDTEIAAIKAKTDQLMFTVPNQVDANALTGGGSTESALLQSTTIATLTSQTVFALTAGSADNDAYNGCLIVLTDQATAAQKSVALVLDYVGSTRTLTLSRAPAFTLATGDGVKILAADSGDLAVTLVAALRAGVVTVRKPISDDGTLELVRGDTYDDWVNPAIVWQVATSTDISAAIATMTVSVKGTKLATTGTVTSAGAELWDIRFEPAVPSDYPLGEGKYDFELKSVAGTNVATPETGQATIKQDVTRPT